MYAISSLTDMEDMRMKGEEEEEEARKRESS